MDKFIINTLSELPLFMGIEAQHLPSVLECLGSETKEYQNGSYIIKSGEQVLDIGIMLTGKALVIQEDYWGNRNIMAHLGNGQIFGETFAVLSEESNVSVVANEVCTVMFLSINSVLSMNGNVSICHNQLVKNLLSVMAEKNRRFNEKLTHICKRTTGEKLLSYLSSVAQKSGKKEFSIPFDRQQLADYLSVDRSAMSYELSKLRAAGIIDYKKNKFIIK